MLQNEAVFNCEAFSDLWSLLPYIDKLRAKCQQTKYELVGKQMARIDVCKRQDKDKTLLTRKGPRREYKWILKK